MYNKNWSVFCRTDPKYLDTLREIDTVSRELAVSKLFSLPSQKVSTLKGKNLLPMGANSFILE